MNKLKRSLLALSIFALGIAQTGCIGPFKLTNKVYDWNKSATGDKFANAAIFVVFLVVPVYSITLLADGIFLNTIEFWGGNAELSMNEGEYNTKYVTKADNTYRITTTKHRVDVEQTTGELKGSSYSLQFNTEDKSWYLIEADQSHKLLTLQTAEDGTEQYLIHGPDGEEIVMNADEASQEDVMAELSDRFESYPLN